MGEPLYEQVTGKVADGKLNRPCRIYAPVGTHETLLAYLVRRLLENGANTSFVNRIADTTLPLDELVADPVQAVEKMAHRKARLVCRIRRLPCRASCTAKAASTRRVWIWPTNTVWRPLLCPAQQRAAEMAGQTDAGAAG
jgi:hypothetical protein